jgi:ribosomal protein L7Ae-like RNA K-turn-binding protein
VILAEDAAPGQAMKVERLLAQSEVPWRRFGSRQELGAALGGPLFSAVGVTRNGLATRLLEELDADVDPREGEPRALEDDQTYAG